MAELIFEGILVSGLGEGAYFLSMEHYKGEIKKKLGFEAYPGTLNIKIEGSSISLNKLVPVRLSGFRSGNKEFGGASCYHGKILDIAGAVIIPDVNKHGEDIVEFIAPVFLRSKLKDGDAVKLIVKV